MKISVRAAWLCGFAFWLAICPKLDAQQQRPLPQSQPVPLLSGLVPSSGTTGSSTLTLTVEGAGFIPGSTVNWNGTSLATTFVSSEQLSANVPASNLATSGTAFITVSGSQIGQGSNVVYLPITLPTSTVFLAQSTISSGANPAAVATADFNGDSRVDLAIANAGSNTITILLGNGDGTFTTTPSSPVGNSPVAIAVADLNADGRLDLAVANTNDNTLSILLGNGDGTFTSTLLNPSTGNMPSSIVAADLNGDGLLDMAVTNGGDGTVSILLGAGNGTFQTQVAYPGGNSPTSVTVGDFNSDGTLDLALVNSTDNTVSILLGNGDGTFQLPVACATEAGPSTLVTADFNDDYKLDLAVVNQGSNTVSILLGNGDGTFGTHMDSATGNSPNALASADLNGDGNLDLVVTNSSDNSMSLLLGNGDGTFQSSVFTATGTEPSAIALADFNDDGRLDAAVSNAGNNDLSVLLQVPQVTLSPGSLSFGNQPVGTSSAAQSVMLSNSGTAQLSIAGIVSSGDFAETNTCGTNIAPGANCSINVIFSPSAAGSRIGTVTITDNAGGSPQTVTLSGTGTAPLVTLTPVSLIFGNQPVGTSSTPQTVTLSNSGSAALSIIGIASSGDFSEINTCGTSVAAGASCSIVVTFTPTATRGRTGAITVSDNAAGSPQTVTLSGTGALAAAYMSPSTASPPGNDSTCNGTAAKPCVSFKKAATFFTTKNNIVVLNSGTFYNMEAGDTPGSAIQSVGSGKSSNPHTFIAAVPDGNHTWISAGILINASTGYTWTQVGTSTEWTISLNASTFVNFERAWYQSSNDSYPQFLPRPVINTAGSTVPNYFVQGKGGITSYSCATSKSVDCPTRGACKAGRFQCYDVYQRDSADKSGGQNGNSYHAVNGAVQDLEADLFENWTTFKARLGSSVSDGTNSCSTSTTQICTTGPAQNGSGFGPIPGHRYLLENCLPTGPNADPGCSTPAQGFYLDRCPTNNCGSGPEATWTLHYYGRPADNPNFDNFVAPQKSKIMNLTGVEYTNFVGIGFGYDNYVTPASGQKGASWLVTVPAAMTCSRCNDVQFVFDSFAHTGNWALEFTKGPQIAAHGNTVSASVFYDSGTGQLRYGLKDSIHDTASTVPQYGQIVNNVFEGAQKFIPNGIGISLFIGNSHHNHVWNNLLYDTYSGAIELGTELNPNVGGCMQPSCTDANNNDIEYNLIYNVGQGVTAEMGAIHTATSSATGNIIANNVIHDVTHDTMSPAGSAGTEGGSYCFYLDQGSSYINLYNNLCYRAAEADINVSSMINMVGNLINNNIFAYGLAGAIRKRMNGTQLMMTFTNNILYFDKGNPNAGPQYAPFGGNWYCNAGPCTSIFALDYNTYFNPGTSMCSGEPMFTSSLSGVLTYFSFNYWQQTLGEDVHSTCGSDPGFVGPSYAAGDNYNFVGAPPAGFSPFNQSLAGLSGSVPPYPPLLGAGFPLQNLNPATDF